MKIIILFAFCILFKWTIIAQQETLKNRYALSLESNMLEFEKRDPPPGTMIKRKYAGQSIQFKYLRQVTPRWSFGAALNVFYHVRLSKKRFDSNKDKYLYISPMISANFCTLNKKFQFEILAGYPFKIIEDSKYTASYQNGFWYKNIYDSPYAEMQPSSENKNERTQIYSVAHLKLKLLLSKKSDFYITLGLKHFTYQYRFNIDDYDNPIYSYSTTKNYFNLGIGLEYYFK